MTDRTFERAVSDWLEDTSDRTPRHAIDAVLLAVKTTPQERDLVIPRRFTTMTSSLRLLAAAIAVVAVVGAGAIWYIGQSVHPSPPTSTRSPIPSFESAPTASPAPPQVQSPSPEVALGWPSAGANGPGLYSWDGRRCAGSCGNGFMHNATNGGSGDVAITIGIASDDPIAAGATAVTIVGHSGFYRRVVEPEPSFAIDILDLNGYEEWIVDIDGVVVAIRLYARPDTSDADLGDAHAIIDSLRYERTEQPPHGFRLTFRLTNGEWDSG